jgi:hypothetical protein
VKLHSLLCISFSLLRSALNTLKQNTLLNEAVSMIFNYIPSFNEETAKQLIKARLYILWLLKTSALFPGDTCSWHGLRELNVLLNEH